MIEPHINTSHLLAGALDCLESRDGSENGCNEWARQRIGQWHDYSNAMQNTDKNAMM